MNHEPLVYDRRSEKPIGEVICMEDHGDGLEVYVNLYKSSDGFNIKQTLFDDIPDILTKRMNVNMYQPKYRGNYLPPITKVIFNGPATIAFFSDGDKIVVKCSETDDFDPYVGICMAIAKKAYQNQSANYMIKHLVDKYYPPIPDELMKALMDNTRKVLGILSNV